MTTPPQGTRSPLLTCTLSTTLETHGIQVQYDFKLSQDGIFLSFFLPEYVYVEKMTSTTYRQEHVEKESVNLDITYS